MLSHKWNLTVFGFPLGFPYKAFVCISDFTEVWPSMKEATHSGIRNHLDITHPCSSEPFVPPATGDYYSAQALTSCHAGNTLFHLSFLHSLESWFLCRAIEQLFSVALGLPWDAQSLSNVFRERASAFCHQEQPTEVLRVECLLYPFLLSLCHGFGI